MQKRMGGGPGVARDSVVSLRWLVVVWLTAHADLTRPARIPHSRTLWHWDTRNTKFFLSTHPNVLGILADAYYFGLFDHVCR